MSSKAKKAGNLVALGSAAVVAVYGAGLMRTAAAAERFAEQSDERVLLPDGAAAVLDEMKSATTLSGTDSNAVSPSAGLAVAPTKSVPSAAVSKADATIAMVDSKVHIATATSPKRDVSVPVPPEVTTVISPSGTAVSSSAAPAAVAKSAAEEQSSPVLATTTSAPVTPAATVAPAPVVPTPTAPVAAPVAPAATEVTVTSPAPAKLKDGEYTGYGTSRHGDIEVYLETTDGRITYIKISQCLTQYSCSWISDLPKQVLARQSPRVDGVSGATQSANAFYYAVVQALAKAK